MSKNKGFIVGTAVFGVLSLAIFVFCLASGGSYAGQLESQATQITTLENEIAAKTAAISAGNSAVVQSVSGIDLERVAHDDGVAEAFIRKVTTWDSWESYTAMRSEIMETYDIGASSNFAQVFLPDYPSKTDPAGNAYNDIDLQKLSCAYESMKSMPCAIRAAQYDYFTIVTCSGAKDGQASHFNFIMTYTVDGAGNLINLDAYTLT